jgi:hypothetical protein
VDALAGSRKVVLNMPVVPFLPAIAAGASGIASIYGASKAAQAQQNAARENNALLREMYGEARTAFQPYVAYGRAGGDALQALLGLSGDPNAFAKGYAQYQDATGYRFRRDEGLNALNQGLANAHMTASGAALKAGVKYNQDFASNDFGGYLDRLAAQQATGLNAASALTGAGQAYAGGVGANNTNAANATARGWAGGTSAFGHALSGVVNAWPASGGGGGGQAVANGAPTGFTGLGVGLGAPQQDPWPGMWPAPARMG